MDDQRPIIDLEEALLLEKTAVAEKKKIIDELEKTLAAEEEKANAAVHPYEYTIAQQKASIERLMARVEYVEEKLVHFVSMVETCIDTSSGALNYAEWADTAIEDLSVGAKEAARVNDHLVLDNRAMKDRIATLVSLETKNKTLIADMTKLLENEKRVREQLKYPDTTPASILEARRRSASMDRIMRAVQAMPDAFDWHHVETLQSLVAVAASLPFGFSAALENLDTQAARADRELKKTLVASKTSPYEPCSNCKFMSDFVLQIVSRVTVDENQIIYAMTNGAAAAAAAGAAGAGAAPGSTTVSRIPFDDGAALGRGGKMMAREGGVGDLLHLSSGGGGGDLLGAAAAGDKKNLAGGATSPSDLAKLTFVSQQAQALTPATSASAKKDASSSKSESEKPASQQQQSPMSPGTTSALESPPVQSSVPPVLPQSTTSLAERQQRQQAAAASEEDNETTKAKKKAAKKKAAEEEAEKKKALMETTQRQASSKKFDLDNVARIVICLPSYLQGDGAVLNDVFENALRWTDIVKKDKTSGIANNPDKVYNVAVVYLTNLNMYSEQSESTFYENWRVDPTWVELDVTRNEYSKLHTVKSTAYRHEGTISATNMLASHDVAGVSPMVRTVYPCIAPSSGYTTATFELKDKWQKYIRPKVSGGGTVYSGDPNCGEDGEGGDGSSSPQQQQQQRGDGSSKIDRADPMFRTINPNTKVLKLAFVAIPYPKSASGKCKLDDKLNMQGGNLSSNMNLITRMVNLLPGMETVDKGTLMVFFIVHLYDSAHQSASNLSSPDQFKRVLLDIVVEVDLSQKSSNGKLAVNEKNIRNINREDIANYWWKHDSLQNYINRYFDNMVSHAQTDLFNTRSEKVISAADYAVYLASLNVLVEDEIQKAMFLPGGAATLNRSLSSSSSAAGNVHETDPFYMPQSQESSNSDFCATGLKLAWETYCINKVAQMDNYVMKGFKKSMLFIVPVYFRNDNSEDEASSCNDNFYRNVVQYLKTYYLDNIANAVELWTDSLQIPQQYANGMLTKFDWQINLGFLKFQFGGNFFPVLLNSTLHILPYTINSLAVANMDWRNIITTRPHEIFEVQAGGGSIALKNKNFDAHIFATSMWMPSDGNYAPLKSKVSLKKSTSGNNVVECLKESVVDIIFTEKFCKYYIPAQSAHADFYKYVIDKAKASIDQSNTSGGSSIKLFGLTGFGYTGYGEDTNIETWEPSTNTYAIFKSESENYMLLEYKKLFDEMSPVFKAITTAFTKSSSILPTSNAGIAEQPGEWPTITNWYDVYAYINGASSLSDSVGIPQKAWSESFTSMHRARLRKKLQPLAKFYYTESCAVTRYQMSSGGGGSGIGGAFFGNSTNYQLTRIPNRGTSECAADKKPNINEMSWIQIVKSPFFQRLMNPLLKPVTVFNTYTNTFVIVELKLEERPVYLQLYNKLKENSQGTSWEDATIISELLFNKSEIKTPNKCPYNIIDVNDIGTYVGHDISNNFTVTNIASRKELRANESIGNDDNYATNAGLFAAYQLNSVDNFAKHDDLQLSALVKRLLKQCLTPPVRLIGHELIYPEFDINNSIIKLVNKNLTGSAAFNLTALHLLHLYVLNILILLMHNNMEHTPFEDQIVSEQLFIKAIFRVDDVKVIENILSILNLYIKDHPSGIEIKFKPDRNQWTTQFNVSSFNIDKIRGVGLLKHEIVESVLKPIMGTQDYILFNTVNAPIKYRKYIITPRHGPDFKLYQSLRSTDETELLTRIKDVFNEEYVTPNIKCKFISDEDTTNIEFENGDSIYCNGEFMVNLKDNYSGAKAANMHMLTMLAFGKVQNTQTVEDKSVPAAFLINSKTFRHQQEVDAMYRPAWVDQIIDNEPKKSPSMLSGIPPTLSGNCQLPTKLEHSIIWIDLHSAFIAGSEEFNKLIKKFLPGTDSGSIIDQMKSQMQSDITSRIIPPYKGSVKFIKDADELVKICKRQLKFYYEMLPKHSSAYTNPQFDQYLLDANTVLDIVNLYTGTIKASREEVKSKIYSDADKDHSYYYMHTTSGIENFNNMVESPPCRPYWQKFFFIIHMKIPPELVDAFNIIKSASGQAETSSPLVNEEFQTKMREIVSSSNSDLFTEFENTFTDIIRNIIASAKPEQYDIIEFIITDLSLEYNATSADNFRNYGWVIPVKSLSGNKAIATPEFYSGVYVKLHNYIQTNATSVDQIFYIKTDVTFIDSMYAEIRKNVIPNKISLQVNTLDSKSIPNLNNYNSTAISKFYRVIRNNPSSSLLAAPPPLSSSSSSSSSFTSSSGYNTPPLSTSFSSGFGAFGQSKQDSPAPTTKILPQSQTPVKSEKEEEVFQLGEAGTAAINQQEGQFPES